MITTKAVMDSLPEDAGAGPCAVLSRFRLDFHACLSARADELCELADAVLCTGGPVKTLAGLAVLVIVDAGYDVPRLAWQLTDLPVQVLGRLRSDRVLHFPAPARCPGTSGRPPRHGHGFALADPATWPEPPVTTTTATSRYGTATAQAWDRLHPRLTHRSAWLGHGGGLPVIEGTLIRLQVDHLRGDRDPKPIWLWWSGTGATTEPPRESWRL